MWCVKISIPADKFVDAMHDMSRWFGEERLDAPHFSYRRNGGGEISFRINFEAADTAEKFAEHFDGRVLSSDSPG